jgi:integrase
MAKTTGIRERHGSWEAAVYDRRSKKKIRKTFPTFAAAKSWRADATVGLHKGTMRAPSSTTLEAAWATWLEAAERGGILARTKRPYKPSSLRGYAHDMATYVLPDLGVHRLADLRADDFQALVDRLNGEGRSGSKVRNVLVPLQALYRHHRRAVPVDPTNDLDLPDAGDGRTRAADPVEAFALLEPLPDDEQALWATAFLAGLRRGELRALRDDDVDLERNVIHVRRGWDDVEGAIEPKSKKGARKAPIPAELRRYLLAHRARTGRRGEALFFGRTASEPFTPTHVRKQAPKAWAAAAVGAFHSRRVADAGARADRPPRVPTHLRQPDVRGRLLARGDRRLRRSLVDVHDRPLPAPARRAARAGRGAARRLPDWRGYWRTGSANPLGSTLITRLQNRGLQVRVLPPL